jgi:predicted nucleotidyltransferase
MSILLSLWPLPSCGHKMATDFDSAAPYPDNEPMSLRDTLYSSHQSLAEAGVDHALIGGLALATLGIHRATFDVDFLVDGASREAATEALEKAGWKLSMKTQEVLHFEGRGRVDLLLANRPLSLEMLAHAPAAEDGLKCVSPEALIGLKIQAYTNDKERELQDKADIKNLVKKYPKMDWEKVRQYADLFGQWPFIESLKATG